MVWSSISAGLFLNPRTALNELTKVLSEGKARAVAIEKKGVLRYRNQETGKTIERRNR